MKTLITILTIILFPVIALAQPDTGTSTVTDLPEVVGEIPGIVSAFQTSVLAGILALLGAVATVLNFGPLKKLIEESSFDWLRPLLMLVSVTAITIIGEVMVGIDTVTAVITGVLAGLGSGYLQKVIQEAQD